jgi:signal transduction histidine kinase
MPLNLPFSVPKVEDEKLFGWSTSQSVDSPDIELTVTRTTRPTRSAGLLPGDALIAIKGEPADPESLTRLRQNARAGDTLQLLVQRGGQRLTVMVPVTESPASSTGYHYYLLGVACIGWMAGMAIVAWRGHTVGGLLMGAAFLLLPPITFSSGVPGDGALLGIARSGWHFQAASHRMFFPALFAHFCLLYLREPGRRRSPWLWPGVYLVLFATLAAITNVFHSPLAWTQLGWERNLRTGVGLVFELLALAAALRLYFRGRDVPSTLRWLSFAIGLFAATAVFRSMLLLTLGGQYDLDIIRRINGLTVILLPVTAILFFFGSRSAEDSEWKHRRRIAFSASVLLTTLYGVAVTGAAAVVLTATGQNLGGAEWILFISIFVATLVFSPVLRWAREMVDRRTMMHWNQLEQLAHSVADRISAEMELGRIGEKVASDFAPLVKVSSATLVLVQEQALSAGNVTEGDIDLVSRSDLIQELARYPSSRVPVYRPDGELIGVIRLGVPAGHHFDVPEQSALRILSQAVGSALRNAESYSELRRVQQELAEAERVASMGALGAGLAHEIKNPLAGLKMGLYLLEREGFESERFRRVDRDVRRIDDLVSSLLRFTHEGLNENVELLDLIALTRSCVVDMRSLAEDRGVVLIERYSDGPVIIRGSEQQMRIVVSNLLTNALDAVTDGDVIEIAITGETALAEITIRDTGTGIPLEVRDRVFDLDFSTKAGGTGLGLALARRETERLGGCIEVVPGEQHGTILRVALPRAI